ncbi:MFS transporter [Nitriliruptor alkaliphilus]|uniref:MFS transporter n=1 Tax=Nitriliruptor alkaliphilus TaxID=427918 RepID=UPI000A64AB05|nr:MFS transporter [Nitriliruptor alkaliphilus]
MTVERSDTIRRASLGAGYRWLLAAAGNANLADGILKAALPLLAVRLTDSPALVAGVAFAAGLPWLLAALHAGALADRLDRRRTMLLANLARALVLAAFAGTIAVGLDRIWLLYAVALGLGLAETLHDTSAQSFLPQLVGRDRLAQANGRLYGVEITANQFVGPPLGAFVLAASAVVAVAVPGALFAVAALALGRIRGAFRPERTGAATSLAADVREGVRMLWDHRLLRTFAWMVGVMNLAGTATFAVLVLYARGPMGLTEGQYGILLTASAIGSLLASLVTERIEAAIGRAWSLRLCVLSGVLAGAVPALTADRWLVGASMVVFGAGVVLWNVVVVSFRQRVTPDRLLGRVNAAFRLLAWGTMPLGAALAGLLGELIGIRAVFACSAGLVALLLLVRISDRDLDEADVIEAPLS